jgi:hypothetical protein
VRLVVKTEYNLTSRDWLGTKKCRNCVHKSWRLQVSPVCHTVRRLVPLYSKLHVVSFFAGVGTDTQVAWLSRSSVRVII